MRRGAGAPPVDALSSIATVEPVAGFDVGNSDTAYALLTGREMESTDDDVKAVTLARAILSVQCDIENQFRIIMEANPNADCRIQAMPENCEDNHDNVSSVQPIAWVKGVSGGYFDPERGRITQNNLGLWEGHSKTFGGHLLHSITTGVFRAYHIVTLVALIIALVLYFWPGLDDVRLWVCGIVVALTLSFPVAVSVMTIISEFRSRFKDAGALQTASQETVDRVVTGIVMNMDPDKRQSCSLGNSGNEAPVRIAGRFLLTYCYEPALLLLQRRFKVGGRLDNVKEWSLVEALLTIYRFVRQVRETNVAEVSTSKFDCAPGMKRLVMGIMQRGDQEAHYQITRLLGNCFLTDDERLDRVKANPKDISLSHYLGWSLVREIYDDLSTPLEMRKASGGHRQNILLALGKSAA